MFHRSCAIVLQVGVPCVENRRRDRAGYGRPGGRAAWVTSYNTRRLSSSMSRESSTNTKGGWIERGCMELGTSRGM